MINTMTINNGDDIFELLTRLAVLLYLIYF